ncbi:MAG: EAL domain-containing protein [Thiohalomonadales bacterium]
MATPLKLLIIDDSEEDTLSLIRELRRGDYYVSYERVFTEQAIFDALMANQIDIVLIDYGLQNLQSAQAITMVKAVDSDIAVIVVSDVKGEGAAVAAMKSGAHDYVMKDNLTRLIPAVANEVREVKSRRARKQAEKTIHYMAFHDSLTGLANRNEFERCLDHAIQSAFRKEVCHTVLYLDLDQFKLINETCGRMAGDQLLQMLAEELKTHVREYDGLARLGGDEFGVLLECCAGEDAMSVAEGILSGVREVDFSWRDKKFAVTCSIGLVSVDHAVTNSADILRNADSACYSARDMGGNRIKQFSRNDEEYKKRRGELQWVSRIHEALEQGHFVLYHQNMLALEPSSADSGNRSFEFLLRIDHPKEPLALPVSFMPAAERYNLMPRIDKWVVDNVFHYLAEQEQGHKTDPRGHYFINLSGLSLGDVGFFAYIKQRLTYYGVDANTVCFEIAETAAISNLSKAVDFIADIKKLGFSFALDDFGGGLSSFSYLKSLQVDYLKIAGGYVQNMLNDEMDFAFVDVINQLGHVAGMQTVAEYVEDEAVLTKLQQMGVDFAQGYYIHKPEPI